MPTTANNSSNNSVEVLGHGEVGTSGNGECTAVDESQLARHSHHRFYRRHLKRGTGSASCLPPPSLPTTPPPPLGTDFEASLVARLHANATTAAVGGRTGKVVRVSKSRSTDRVSSAVGTYGIMAASMDDTMLGEAACRATTVCGNGVDVICGAGGENEDYGGGCSSNCDASTAEVKFTRRSPCGSESDHITTTGGTEPLDHFQRVPWHIMYRIFDTLELRDRVRAAMVCRRWHTLLNDGRFPLDDLVVLNVFERHVWKNALEQSAGSKFRCIELSTFEEFAHLLRQCHTSSSVKIWYSSKRFSRRALETLHDGRVKMRCLDIFPYSAELDLSCFHEWIPDLRGISMRPHGVANFYSGLNLDHFPAFKQLDTLNIDSINLADEVELPETLTTLEWQNRNVAEFRRFMPKLARLRRLQFLLLAHADFVDEDFQRFVGLTHYRRMPDLNCLLFKFVKLENVEFCVDSLRNDGFVAGEADGEPNATALNNDERANAAGSTLSTSATTSASDGKMFSRLQLIKLDLCYGDLPNIVDVFLALTSSRLRILSLNVISDDDVSTPRLLRGLASQLAEQLQRRQVALHLGLLQRDSSAEFEEKRARRYAAAEAEQADVDDASAGKEGDSFFPALYASSYFQRVLSKLEASFVSDTTLFHSLFGGAVMPPRYALLTDLKFIRCDALTDSLLGAVASSCPNLRKLSILSCENCGESGVRHFVEYFHNRLSTVLKIVWKRDRRTHPRPANFFLNLINEYGHLLAGLKYRFVCKVFGEDNDGEAILIWHQRKWLHIQDYDDFDRNRILGIILPGEDEETKSSSGNGAATTSGRAGGEGGSSPKPSTAELPNFAERVAALKRADR